MGDGVLRASDVLGKSSVSNDDYQSRLIASHFDLGSTNQRNCSAAITRCCTGDSRLEGSFSCLTLKRANLILRALARVVLPGWDRGFPQPGRCRFRRTEVTLFWERSVRT